MLDRFKQPISIGDTVIYSTQHTVGLQLATVIDFTAKKVRIQDRTRLLIKDPYDIIVFTKQHEYALATWPEQYI